jgi:Ca2+:H+ antiporter
MLLLATALVAVVSELLTGAIEPLSREVSLSAFFVGLIVLPLVGGAAEYATAMRSALADHMEATLAVTAGSSIQIALLIAPLLILVSPLVGAQLDLDFSQLELVIFGLVAGLFAIISLDGESTWLEGMQLCIFYLIVAVGAYFITG